jgi:hypothetical protein
MGYAQVLKTMRDTEKFDKVLLTIGTVLTSTLSLDGGVHEGEIESGSTLAAMLTAGGPGTVVKLKNGTGGNITVTDAGSAATTGQFNIDNSGGNNFTWGNGEVCIFQKQDDGSWRPLKLGIASNVVEVTDTRTNMKTPVS